MKKLSALAGLAVAIGVGAGVHRSGKLDTIPPRIEVDLPDGPLSGDVQVEISVVDTAPGVARVHVSLDGGPPEVLPLDGTGHASWTWKGGPNRQPGPHTLTIDAVDNAWQPNAAQHSVARITDDHPPVLRIKIFPDQPPQGTVAAIYVWSDEPLNTSQVDGLDQSWPLEPTGDGTVYRALLGVGVGASNAPAPLHLTATDHLGNQVKCTVPIDVVATDFPRGGYIRLSGKQVKARKDVEALQAMRAARTAAYTHIDPVQHWHGAVTRPVTGRRTSRFGRYRTYSDGRKKHHLGTDLANITGTPVHAALAGVVRAAGWQHLFGNAVIVHHGQGLTTSYNHLSALDVEVGQAVDEGQQVGKLGSTGQSTGPHLHWGMQVGEVEVDPERWPDHGFSVGALQLTAEDGRPCAVTNP